MLSEIEKIKRWVMEQYHSKKEFISSTRGVLDKFRPIITKSTGYLDASFFALSSITNAMLANMAQATIKGRASGAGTGTPTDLTAAQVATIVNASLDHGTLTGLADDDHAQYLLLGGRSGGQTISDKITISANAIPILYLTGALGTNDFLRTYNSSAASTANLNRQIFQLNTDTAGRTAFDLRVNLTDITDATRTSKVEFVTLDNAVFATRLTINASNIGIGTTTPTKTLEVQGTGKVIHLRTAANGDTVLSQTMAAILMSAASMSAALPYTPALAFGSTDPQFTTTTPKIGAGLVGRATETYAADTNAGMALDFFTTPNNAGASPTPSIRLTIDQNGRVGINGITAPTEVLDVGGRIAILGGAAANTAIVGGTLYITTTQTGNVGTGEDVLASYSVPASTLGTNGDSVWFEAAGTAANNANAKTLRVRFGTTGTNLVLSVAMIASAALQWTVRGRVIRTGAATQKGYATYGHNVSTAPVSVSNVVTGLNQTLSGAITLQVTGDATSNNDIVIETFVVGWDGNNT